MVFLGEASGGRRFPVGQAEQAANKLTCPVILSEAKNLSSI
jgi:hypothetical protein